MEFVDSVIHLASKIAWTDAIAGALVAALPILIAKSVTFIRNQLSSQRQKYRGKFYLYHWSGTRPIIRTKVIIFKSSFRRGIKVIMPSDPITNLSYTGTLLRGDGEVVYVGMDCDSNKEHVFLAFYNPIHPLFVATRGIMLSVSLDYEPMSWKMVLSRNPLTPADIKVLLDERQLLSVRKVNFRDSEAEQST